MFSKRLIAPLSTAALLLLSSCQSAPSATSEAAAAQTAEETPAPQTAEETTPESRSNIASDILSKLAKRAWSDLMSSEDTCEQHYDYFPGGGIRSFYCHLQGFATFDQIETILDMPVFLSGPHQNGQLDHDSKTSFGHYNPTFVQSIATWAIPAAHDTEFQRATQGTYNRGIETLARTYWATYQKLKAHPHYWSAQQSEVQEYLAGSGMPDYYYEKYFTFMNPDFIENRSESIEFFYERGFDGDYDGNVVKSAVGFWIRRGIDGTAEEFADGLQQLLAVYDPAMLAK